MVPYSCVCLSCFHVYRHLHIPLINVSTAVWTALMFGVHEFVVERLTTTWYIFNFLTDLKEPLILWLQSLGTRDTDKQALFTNKGLIASVYEDLVSSIYWVLRLYVYRSCKSGPVPSIYSNVHWQSNIMLGVLILSAPLLLVPQKKRINVSHR